MSDNLICPKCGKVDTSRDDLHLKVSGIYTSGQATGSYRDYEGYRSYDTIQSQLSKRLTPPKVGSRPSHRTNIQVMLGQAYLLVVGGVATVFFVATFIYPNDMPPGHRIIPLSIAALCLYGLLRGPQNIRNKVAQKIVRWERARDAYDLWNRLYYCRRHDTVFDPESGFSIASDQLQDYWREAAK